MSDIQVEIKKLKRRITGLEKTLKIVAGHSGRTEQSLRRLFEVTSDTLPVPLVIATQTGKILFANPKCRKIFGYTGQDFQAILTPMLYENPEDRQKMWERAEKDETKGFTVNLRKADGSIFPASLFSRLITFESRNCLLTAIYDLSDLRREEEKRLALERQLRHTRKMEAIGIMAGGIAHDFNNLLHAINGYTQILLYKRSESSPDYKELIQIENAANRAAILIRQLLTFSRKAETNRRPMDLNQEVRQAQKILQRTLPKMIAIHLNLAPDLKKIAADPTQIELIILNTGNNAADAMPDGGDLMIDTQNIYLDEPYCAGHPGTVPGEYIRLTIADTGHGMSSETLGHIFEPFFTTKGPGKGTGLGLASVYGIVKNHGGHIYCSSKPDHGTTFDIYFPASHGVDEYRPVQEKQQPVTGGFETILVVDDEETIRDLARQFLQSVGYQVMTAKTGEEAVELFAAETDRIDLIILDLGMPGMGGHKCLSQILKIDENTRVIIASGYSMNGEVKKSLDAGAVGFIAKPYQLNDLLVKVRTILDA
jgi:two-component system cell cycle sensor histidine kinase/response regulator CckA